MSFKTVSTTDFNSDFQYGDVVNGSYPLSASITRNYFSSSVENGESRARLDALKNTTNYYKTNNQYYAYSSEFKGWDKQTQQNLI